MVYCGFFLIGKIIQRFVFGDLRPIELQVESCNVFFVTNVYLEVGIFNVLYLETTLYRISHH